MYDLYDDMLWKERWARMRWWQKFVHCVKASIFPAILLAWLVAVMATPRQEKPVSAGHLPNCCVCPCDSAKP